MERSPQDAGRGTWALSDGRAGNARQAMALAAALDAAATAHVLAPRAPWRWCAPRCLPVAQAAFGAPFAAMLERPPALAIGCGRQAALATRLLRERGARSVQVLDPRIGPAHWDVVVVPEHDRLRGDNVVTLLGSLNPVDDAWLERARAQCPAPGAFDGPRTALLVGGPTAQAGYDRRELSAWLDAIDAILAREGGCLMVSASRRTPARYRARLRARCAGRAALCWLDERDGPNPYAGVLAWADRIVCTPDSVNMVSEAAATRAPVFVADPGIAQGRLRRFLDALSARGRIRPLDGALAPFAVEPLRETARVAADVRRRLGMPDA
jgi:mitochondrial fission protein ELM1